MGLPGHMVAQFLPLNPPPFCSHYWLFPVDIPPAARGHTGLYNPLSIYCLEIFAYDHSDCCQVKVFVGCICISFLIPDVELFPWPLLLNKQTKNRTKKIYKLNMPLEIVFLKGCPLLNFFVDI